MSRYVWMSVICLTFGLASHGGKADSQQSAVEFMEEYLSTFDSGYAQDITDLYNDPFYMVAPNGDIQIFESEKGIRKAIKSWKFYMKKGGVARSQYGELNVQALSEDTAIASALVERINEEEELLTSTGATYNLRREAGSWKIFVIQLHGAGSIIRFK